MLNEPKDLYSLVAQKALRNPEDIAFITLDKRISFHELLFSIDRAADMFWQMEIRKNDKIAIALKNSIEFVISYFALVKLGAVSVPVNFMVSKEKELLYILENCGAKGVVTEKDFANNYLKLPKKLNKLNFIISADYCDSDGVIDFWKSLKHAHYHPQTQETQASENDVASILYTSGTTGHPKGVVLTHRNLLFNAKAAMEVMQPTKKDVFMCLLPMFHTLAWTANVILPLYAGAKTLIIKNISPPKAWLKAMGKEGVTIMVSVPQIYGILAKEAKGAKKYFLKYWALRKVRFCVSGAAPLGHAMKKEFEKVFKAPLLEGYGLTETSPVVTASHPNKKRHGSVGRPLPGVKIKIVDDNNRHLRTGEAGEICVQGPSVTSGYHENDLATKELLTDDGWLKTGDIGVIDDDGYLFIKDRKKDMVIVKGLKVFPAQIEQVLNNHPKIQETAVIGIPQDNDSETMKCFCVPKKGTVLEISEIKRYIKEHLDVYKRPREIEIIENLPKNTLQKTLKRVLLEMELEKNQRQNIRGLED